MTRRVALLTHDQREDAKESAKFAEQALIKAGVHVEHITENSTTNSCELVLVIGGDGTILRAAEIARQEATPILGINFGHVGFLAEEEPDSLHKVVDAVVAGNWTVDTRMTIDVQVTLPDGTMETGWALNEASVEKSPQSRMIEVDLGVDGRGLSSFKADNILVATPTGSTAYSFSAGGPIVWPDVEAFLITPVAAHALFARPLVVGPDSRLDVVIQAEDAVVWLDGRRAIHAPVESQVTVTRGRYPVQLARINNTPFSGRLVKKFHLPVEGWRRREVRN
ncbi:MAG: NAD kinase [Trueperella sp.]|nr:NAD kinase [Trueperella sp.]